MKNKEWIQFLPAFPKTPWTEEQIEEFNLQLMKINQETADFYTRGLRTILKDKGLLKAGMMKEDVLEKIKELIDTK